MNEGAVRRHFLCVPLVEGVEPLVPELALVDQADLVSGFPFVGEEVLDGCHQMTDVGLRAELFEQLSAKRFGSLLAELDRPAEKPEERLVLDLVPTPLDEDPVSLADQSERLRAYANLSQRLYAPRELGETISETKPDGSRLPRHASAAKEAKDGQHNYDDDDDPDQAHVILSLGANDSKAEPPRFATCAAYVPVGSLPVEPGPASVEAAAGFLRRFRPPRLPRRVRFFLGG